MQFFLSSGSLFCYYPWPKLNNNSISWTNWAGNQTCTPYNIVRPKNKNELVSLVKQAHAEKKKIHAVGSGHSWSDIVCTDGYLIDLKEMKQILEIDTAQNLTNFIQVPFPDAYSYPQYQAYGVEFSPGGNKLYVSLKGASSKLYEMRVDTLALDTIQASMNGNLAASLENGNTFGALQAGPDGQVYMAIDGFGNLPYITPNDQVDVPSLFNATGPDLAGKTSALGLPNFIQRQSSAVGGVSASISGICVDQPTNFVGQQSSNIDHYSWTVTRLSDTTTIFTSTNLTDTYTFQQPGDYGVAFHIFNRCGLDTTINQTITIKDTPPESEMPDAQAICSGDLLLEVYAIDDPQYTYLWNTGATGRTLNEKQ